ncbi:hypothetical protein ACFX2F_033449 [Malus domestica]
MYTIVYATHIFDGLEDWPSHIAYVANGKLQLAMPMEKVREISKLSLMCLGGFGSSKIYHVSRSANGVVHRMAT